MLGLSKLSRGYEALMLVSLFEFLQVRVVALLKKEERYAAERARREEGRDQEKRKGESADDLTLLAILSAQSFQRELDQFRADLQDTITVARMDLARATKEEAELRELLKGIQGRATTLPDGRRVYFTRNGLHLYEEDGQEIVANARITEAREHLEKNSNRASFEDFQLANAAHREAVNILATLADTLDRLDNLELQSNRKGLSAEELASMRKELDATISSLSHLAQAQLRQLKIDRKDNPSHKEAPALSTQPILASAFRDAQASMAEASTVPPAQSQTPAYKAIPSLD